MTKKLAWKVDDALLNFKNANQDNFKKQFKLLLKQLQIYYFKLSIMFFLLFLFFSIFAFFSLSSILASMIVFKKIPSDYLFIFRHSFDLNTIFYVIWKALFMIVIFLFLNMLIIIKFLQIYQIKKNLNKKLMIKAVGLFCQTKVLPQNFSRRKKSFRFSMALFNIALMLLCALSFPIPNSLIKYEVDELTYKEMIDKIKHQK